ncbi:hypothetical protein CUROG_08545 [Corynebacterium urogenitale]|uniref:Uncharacterized protein n=1 Tax=Corynebacterium urogenitale TaxID=2487892 RepID=A0A5J6ZC04_9CORY|nr:hypothetical protein [Corynebacterium urogenitale]QFQ03057.1 hypothetical protein CUROG_08545 [Corynebacterium urogenitale]
MARSLLVTPDLKVEELDIELSQAGEVLGGSGDDRLHVAFVESGLTIAAIYSSEAAKAERPEPNPLASMGRKESETGDSRFLSDPTRAILGPVLFVGEGGADLTDEEVDSVFNGIRALEHYQEDQQEEYLLWHDAVINLTRGL